MSTITHQPRSRSAARAARLIDEPGFRFGLAEGALALATLAVALLHLAPGAALALLALTAVTGSFEVRRRWAVVLGLSCWACWTGFVENGLGQLTLSPHDLARAALLVLLSLASAQLARWRSRRG